jgi:hypothetical protein
MSPGPKIPVRKPFPYLQNIPDTFIKLIKPQSIKRKYTHFWEPRLTLVWEAAMGEAFLDRVISIFTGDNEPDTDKRILLKMVSRDLTQNRFISFYRMKTEEASPVFASFVYEIYRLVYPVRIFFNKPENEALLKQLCSEAFMDSQTAETARRLSPESIEKRCQTIEGEVLVSQLKDDLNLLASSFNESPRKLEADNCYRLLGLLNRFVCFNFMFLLQKFDPALTEGNISAQPKFKYVRVEYITEDINDFLAVSAPLERGEDWKSVMGVLKAAGSRIGGNQITGDRPAAGARDIILPEHWNNLLVKLWDLNQSKMLPLMVQHSLKDPVWQWKAKNTEEKGTAKSWFDLTSSRVQEIIDRISGSIQSARIEALAQALFGTADITRLRYYTRRENEIFQRKNLGGFIYAAGLNYLAAFIQDYMDKEIRELCDLLLIRGQWTAIELARETSGALFQISGMTEEITSFDEVLSESGKLGGRLKSDLGRVDREIFRANQIRSILTGLNAQALEIINSAVSSLLTIGKNLKNLIHDYQQNPHDLVTNWKELESYSKSPIGPRLDEAYKNIYHFVQLLKLFTAL